MCRQICILLLLVATYVDAFDICRFLRLARPSIEQSCNPRGMTLNKEKSKEHGIRKRWKRGVANVGLLAGGLMPGRAIAQQRPPAAIVAESAKARQNPRDVWTGEKKTEAPEKDDVKLGAKQIEKPSAVDIKMGTSSFVRDAVRNVGSSVVRVDCEREITPLQMIMHPGMYQEGDTMKISGSGFIASTDGYVLTNQHVIEGSKKTTVSLANGRTYKCAVVAEDELTDLAVLKVDVPKEEQMSLVTAPLGDSASLQSGDWVIAVGCPVGLDFSCSLGIVSSPLRSASEVGATHLKGTYIQTDAALNSGNSGGPLVNDLGEVVGINTMVRTNTEAIGFAIPINRARKIFEVLKQGRKPTHAYFGLEVSSITPDFAHIHNDDPNAQRLPEVHGALVRKVLAGSPAAASGLRRNDIIIEVNGRAVSGTHDADVYLDACAPGHTANLKVARGEGGQIVELRATPQNVLTIIEEKRRRRAGQPPAAAFAMPRQPQQQTPQGPRVPGAPPASRRSKVPVITA